MTGGMRLSRLLVRGLDAMAPSPAILSPAILAPVILAKTRLHVADATAITLAACATLPAARQVLGAMDGAHGPCRVIGRKETLPPAFAAYANAALVHALDYDDIHDLARLHPTAVTLPAALAAADLVGPAAAPAQSVLRAVALGNELMCRLGTAWAPSGQGPGADWFLTQLFGYFGAALAAGLVLGLSEDQLVSAQGLAYMQAAGGKQAAFGTGSDARSIYPAFAAMGGTHAALQARAGVTGPEGAYDGDAGLFPLYIGAAATPAQEALLLRPDDWVWAATEIKPWPSCRLSHPYLAAALAARAQLEGRVPERIVIAVNGSAARLCHPLAGRRRPATLQDAKYSVPFMTGFMLAHGHVDLGNMGPAAPHDPAALALAALVEPVQTLPDGPGHPPAEITVEAGGRRITTRAGDGLSLGPAEVEAKFRDCLVQAKLGDAAAELWRRLVDCSEPLAAFDLTVPEPSPAIG